MVGYIFPICFLFVSCLSSTFAVGPCNEGLVAKLAKCYTQGKVPNLTTSGGVGTHIVWTNDDFPKGVQCVTAYQKDHQSYVSFYLVNGTKNPVTVPFEEKGNYLKETGVSGGPYRLYVIFNEEYVYGYYRCSEDPTKTGNHQVNVAINCKYLNSPKSLQVVEKAKQCFSNSGIQNLITVKPCPKDKCV